MLCICLKRAESFKSKSLFEKIDDFSYDTGCIIINGGIPSSLGDLFGEGI